MIRKITKKDIYRVSEILVFNNRINYYPIFKDIKYSFEEYNVFDLGNELLNNGSFRDNTFIYEDEVVKGFVYVENKEIKKLYVDSFFQKQSIGKELIEYAIKEFDANHVWALEKNDGAIRFYERFGFVLDGNKDYEEGTSEYLVHLVR